MSRFDAPTEGYTRTVGAATLKVTAHYDYNRTDYDLRLVEGDWPTDEELLKAFGAVPQCGGGKVTDTGTTRHVLVWGCD